ncbi:MAG: metal ABC transporter permease [Proteobacteria bacterium]|nr:metal ABC transporter permease [Pseudomonadota bacterium]
MDVIELLNFGFIQRAIITGVFIAILCSSLGIFLVLRRLSLIGDGLAHVTLSGVALGLLLQMYPLYMAIPVTLISGLGILKLIDKTKLSGDTAIGIVSSAGISLGIIMASIAGGFNVDLFSFLFGNILTISFEEMILSILLSLIVIGFIIALYNKLISSTFDEELAKVSGINTKMINGILILLTSLTVVLSMKIIGIMLVSSFLILPNVSALQFAKSFKSSIIISCFFSILSVLSGIVVSFALNLPTGATIVLINLLILILSMLIRQSK